MLLGLIPILSLALARCEEAGPPPSVTPPAGATLLNPEVTPEMIVASVLSVKGEAAKKAAAAQWVDQWIVSPGWFGSIERLSEEQGRTVAWLKYSASAMIGGSFLVGVDVAEAGGRDLTNARQIEFTGRIEKIEYGMAGPILEFKIVVRNGRILKADGK